MTTIQEREMYYKWGTLWLRVISSYFQMKRCHLEENSITVNKNMVDVSFILYPRATTT